VRLVLIRSIVLIGSTFGIVSGHAEFRGHRWSGALKVTRLRSFR